MVSSVRDDVLFVYQVEGVYSVTVEQQATSSMSSCHATSAVVRVYRVPACWAGAFGGAHAWTRSDDTVCVCEYLSRAVYDTGRRNMDMDGVLVLNA